MRVCRSIGCLGREATPPSHDDVAAYPVRGQVVRGARRRPFSAYAAQGYRLLKIARSGDVELMRRWLERARDRPAGLLPVIVVDGACVWPDADEALRRDGEVGSG